MQLDLFASARATAALHVGDLLLRFAVRRRKRVDLADLREEIRCFRRAPGRRRLDWSGNQGVLQEGGTAENAPEASCAIHGSHLEVGCGTGEILAAAGVR